MYPVHCLIVYILLHYYDSPEKVRGKPPSELGVGNLSGPMSLPRRVEEILFLKMKFVHLLGLGLGLLFFLIRSHLKKLFL